VADDPGRAVIARKALRPIDQLHASTGELRIGDAVLSDHGATGGFDDVAWDLRWTPSERTYRHVHPVAERLGLVQSVLELPHADLAIEGMITYSGARLELTGARGAQAHIWGSKHADNWAWVHCNDLRDARGEPVRDAFLDAVSVRARRGGREIGPFTPVLGRFGGRDFLSVSPLRVLTNWSTFGLTGWRFEAVAGARKLIAEVDAERDRLAGVTYHDPDGELAYCYNGETATMRLHIYERTRQVGGWTHRQTLVAPGRAHFEYAQREPVAGLELLTQ
jgi:hypothetical protein